ncbi:hypothetical protein NL50_01325 [Clostridium acetobutylicum]|nr:hypothetical protein NL50_01325 [Clostridium acetobutylicum]
MKIAMATGMIELDREVEEILGNRKDTKISMVNYREFFKIETFDVVVLSDRLMGDTKIQDLFFILKSNNTRIIYLTNCDDVKGVKRCFSYSVNDILFDPVKPNDIIKLILKPNSFSDIKDIYLRYKGIPNSMYNEKISTVDKKIKVVEKKVEIPVKEIVYKPKILKKNIITVYTAEDSLLTADFITQLSVILSKKVQQKILILDFNTLFPVMDDFLGVTKEIEIESVYDLKKSTSLVLMHNAIERNMLNENNITKFVKRHPKYKNIEIATGLYDLILAEKIPKSYYEEIVNTAAKVYDTILINTNPDISLVSTFIPIKLSSKVIFITRPNYTSIRNTLLLVDNLKNIINKDKLKFVISEISSRSLDSDTIEKLFEGYNIIGYLKKNDRREEALNKQKPFIDTLMRGKDTLKEYVALLEKLEYIPKPSIFSRLFIKEEEGL